MAPVTVERTGFDPRPRLRSDPPAIEGVRCAACSHPSLEPVTRCPVCGGEVAPTTFASTGTVFSGTVLRIPVGDRTPPISLAYVDLDDGPRVLGHGDDPARALRPGERAVLVGATAEGDPRFAGEETERSGARPVGEETERSGARPVSEEDT